MSRYEKGANFERALVQKFLQNGFIALRAAGSGIMSFKIPDIVAIKNKKIILIECKTTKKNSISLKDAIFSLKKISRISKNTEIYLAVKFPRKDARFFQLKNLLKKKNYTISLKDNYMEFESIL